MAAPALSERGFISERKPVTGSRLIALQPQSEPFGDRFAQAGAEIIFQITDVPVQAVKRIGQVVREKSIQARSSATELIGKGRTLFDKRLSREEKQALGSQGLSQSEIERLETYNATGRPTNKDGLTLADEDRLQAERNRRHNIRNEDKWAGT